MPPRTSPSASRSRGRPNSARTWGAASTVRRRVQQDGARFWRAEDFAGLPPAAVATTLSRLAHDGTLQRVAKGVYYRSEPTALGPSLPSQSAAAARTLHAPLHPAGLSAANALGLSTQNPARAEYATPAPARPRALRGAAVHTRRPASRAELSSEDAALLETLRSRARFSDLSPARTTARLLRLLAEDDRFERLAAAALDEPPRVRAMLGTLGQQLGGHERAVAKLRASLNPLSRFDFGILRSLPHAREWQAK